MSRETLIEMAKDTPIAGAGVLTLFGVPINTYVLVLTLAWAAWRLATAVVEFYWKWKDRRDGSNRQDTGPAPRAGSQDSDRDGAESRGKDD